MLKELFIVFIATFCAAQFVLGQTEKGTMLLGGNAVFGKESGDEYLNANIRIGGFVDENVAIGLGAGVFTTIRNTSFSLVPFLRFYFQEAPKKNSFLIHAAGGVSRNTDTFGDTKFTWTLGLPYVIFLNESIALEIGPEYSRIGSSGRFTFNVGFGIHYKK
jgi:hypothetical protein